MTETAQFIFQKLNEDRLQNAMMIRALLRFPNAETAFVGDSIAVQEPINGMWMFSLKKKGDFQRLLPLLHAPLSYSFLISDSTYYTEVCEAVPTAAGVEYLQFVIDTPKFMKGEETLPAGLELVKLDESWVDFILAHYGSREFGRREYVEKCLQLNPSCGALLNGERVGFHLSHLNGEMGPICVLPKARGLGIARWMSHEIMPPYLADSGIGAAMILPDNRNCRSMIRDTNLRLAPHPVVWMYTEKVENFVANEKIMLA